MKNLMELLEVMDFHWVETLYCPVSLKRQQIQIFSKILDKREILPEFLTR
jgi:hypothetical protein